MKNQKGHGLIKKKGRSSESRTPICLKILPLIAATILSLTGCGQQTQAQRCIVEKDGQRLVIEDKYCNVTPGGPVYVHPIYGPLHPLWWYGGNSSGGVGSYITGGSRQPTPGISNVRPNSPAPVTRGGFGNSSSGGGAVS